MPKGAGGLRPSNFDPSAFAEGDTIARIAGKMQALQLQPTNQGVNTNVFGGSVTVSTLISSTSVWTALPGLSGNFTAPYSGSYTFLVSATGYLAEGNTTTAELRLNITGATAGQFQGAGTSWHCTRNSLSQRGQWASFVTISLNRGSHAITLESKLTAGNLSGMRFDTVAGAACDVLISGGTASVFSSELKRVFHPSLVSTTSASFVTIQSGTTNGSVTIPASGVFDFEVELNPYATVSICGVQMQLLIDGTPVATSGKYGITSGISNQCLFTTPVTITAGTHTWEVKWLNTGGGGTLNLDSNSFFRVVVRGGAAVNASLDARGDSWQATIQEQLESGDGTIGPFFIGYAPATASLRGLSIGLDGGVVSAGTATVNLKVNGATVASAVLNTTDTTVKVNDTDTPVVLKGAKIELEVVKAGSFVRSGAVGAVNVGVVAYLSVSTAVKTEYAEHALASTFNHGANTNWEDTGLTVSIVVRGGQRLVVEYSGHLNSTAAVASVGVRVVIDGVSYDESVVLVVTSTTRGVQTQIFWVSPILSVGTKTVKIQATSDAAQAFSIRQGATGVFGSLSPWLKVRALNV